MYGEDGGPVRGAAVVVVAFKSRNVVSVVTLFMLSRLRNVVYAERLKLMLLSVVV